MKNFIIFILLLTTCNAIAQRDSIDNELRFKIEVEPGLTTYLGVVNNRNVKFTSNNSKTIKIGQRIDLYRIGAYVYGSFGSYGQNQNKAGTAANFNAKFSSVGLDLRLYPIKQQYLNVALTAGVNYMMTKFSTDLKDSKGIDYNYWKDGTIRNLPETYTNNFTSVETKRDYVYETDLGKKNQLFFPLGAMLELRPMPKIKIGFVGQYYLTPSKDINLVLKSNKSEGLLYTGMTLTFAFYKTEIRPDPAQERYKNVDFYALQHVDSDGDGVQDFEDDCPDTKRNQKVTKHGCPEDSDDDGIIDPKDDEKNSKHPNYTNIDGVEQTPGDQKLINQEAGEDAMLFTNMSEEQIEEEINRRIEKRQAKEDKEMAKGEKIKTINLNDPEVRKAEEEKIKGLNKSK